MQSVSYTHLDVYKRQPCNKLYVLLEGKLRTDIIDGLGNEVMIEYIIAPRTVATPHLCNPNNTLPEMCIRDSYCIAHDA